MLIMKFSLSNPAPAPNTCPFAAHTCKPRTRAVAFLLCRPFTRTYVAPLLREDTTSQRLEKKQHAKSGGTGQHLFSRSDLKSMPPAFRPILQDYTYRHSIDSIAASKILHDSHINVRMKLPSVNCRVSSGIAPKPTRLRSTSYGAVASPFIPTAPMAGSPP